jgi:hypothetical protein
MSLRVRFSYPTGATLTYSVERLSDGQFFDFTSSTFKSSAWVSQRRNLLERSGVFAGTYADTLVSTPQVTWQDGDYNIAIHDNALANQVVAMAPFRMAGGDDRDLAQIYLNQPLINVRTATLGGAFHGSWLICWGGQLVDRARSVLQFFGITGTPGPGQIIVPAIEHEVDNIDRPTQRRPLP